MRTSQVQIQIMIEFMERFGDLSKPFSGPHGRQKNMEKWKDLTLRLNSDGSGDPRSEEKWRKVWSDFKNNSKKKAAKINRAVHGTGGGPAQKNYLTDLEERVMSIIGKQAATGMPAIPEAGFAQNVCTDDNMDSEQTIYVITTEDDGEEQTLPNEVQCQNLLQSDLIGDEVWNKPSGSCAPTSQPPDTTPMAPPKKKAKKNTDLATEAFLEAERQRDSRYFELEKERLQQRDRELQYRDRELQLQAQWRMELLEIAKEALKLLNKYLDNP